jgi:hypothetical protein
MALTIASARADSPAGDVALATIVTAVSLTGGDCGA